MNFITGGVIMLRKLGRNYQVCIPKKIVEMLHLDVNDYIDVTVKGNRIILEPQVLIPKAQLYFYTPEWQKDEGSASQDIQEGRATKTKNLKELFKELDK